MSQTQDFYPHPSAGIAATISENPTLQQMMNRRSCRHYTSEPLTDDQMATIIAAVERGPNWCNFQHASIISVDNPDARQRAFELCGNQSQVKEAPTFLMFCADFYRTWIACNCDQRSFDQVTAVQDNLIVASVEVGIALGSATVAAESMGLATCCIGAAREQAPEMTELLGLPRYVFPVCGFCVGHPASTVDLKPRLPESAVFFRDKYNPDLQKLIADYDETYHHYLATRSSGQKDGTWSGEVSAYYTIPYKRYWKIPATLHEQGF